MIVKEQTSEQYPISPTVLFTEDDWASTYEGYIVESSVYSYKIRSRVYGTLWISKTNVRFKTENTKTLQK